jgi:hypothetical protein
MAEHVPPSSVVSRRSFLAGATLLPLAGLVPGLVAQARAAAPDAAYHFFSAHQAAVLDAATRRLIPGPEDDPAEIGHPGAHEVGALRYIDTMLSLFDFSPPRLFTGGPWSNRHAAGPNHMAEFVPPDLSRAFAWRKRIADLRVQYAAGVKLLDAQAGGDFSTASKQDQDQILASPELADFMPLLFTHTIEGMYSVPEYGGNVGLAGWTEVGYPGDSQPRGYTAEELAETQISVVDPTGITAQVLEAFPTVATLIASKGRRHGG